MVSFLLTICLVVGSSLADDLLEDRNPISSQENEHAFVPPETENVENNNIGQILEKMESIASVAEKSRREGILPGEHVEKLHYQMVETLIDLTEQLKHPLNTYKFLNSKGIDRIITPIIGINYEPLKEQLLIVIKTLFKVAPTTTNALIPISVIDKLLDIFEHDDNLALKAHALDIMYIWLPNNPHVQARVMKLKGLEPFYNQISKLDSTVVQTLMELFNKILEEHKQVRNNKSQRNKEDYDKIKLYEMIGLIERMSLPQVCNGILNILEALFTFTNDSRISASSFDLVKNIKPFCLKQFKGKDKAIKIFDYLKRYVADSNKINLLHDLGIDVTELKAIVEDFAINIKENVRDEF